MVLAAAFIGLSAAECQAETVRPVFTLGCVLQAVAYDMKVQLRPDVPLPEVIYSSRADLETFRDDVEPQWGVRPDAVTSAYIAAKNRIYLFDDAQYYSRLGRFIDDSLAHELAHYVQIEYRGGTIETITEWDEADAIHVQNWFRENYMKGRPPLGAPDCR